MNEASERDASTSSESAHDRASNCTRLTRTADERNPTGETRSASRDCAGDRATPEASRSTRHSATSPRLAPRRPARRLVEANEPCPTPSHGPKPRFRFRDAHVPRHRSVKRRPRARQRSAARRYAIHRIGMTTRTRRCPHRVEYSRVFENFRARKRVRFAPAAARRAPARASGPPKTGRGASRARSPRGPCGSQGPRPRTTRRARRSLRRRDARDPTAPKSAKFETPRDFAALPRRIAMHSVGNTCWLRSGRNADRSVTCTGLPPKCLGRGRWGTLLRAPIRLRPAPSRLPPHVFGNSSFVCRQAARSEAGRLRGLEV